MPVPKPGSLTHDEVYSLVAFLLYRNGIILETDVMDIQSSRAAFLAERGAQGDTAGGRVFEQ
jgi:hypothetical protein